MAGGPQFTDEELTLIAEGVLAGKTNAQIWRDFEERWPGRRTRASIHSARAKDERIRSMIESGVPAMPPPAPSAPVDPFDPRETTITRLKDELTELRAAVKSKRSESVVTEVLTEAIRSHSAALPLLSPHRPKVSGAEVEEDILALFSDQHADQIVKSERVLGFEEYGWPQFCRRFERWVDTLIGWSQNHLAGHSFPRLWIAALGDAVEGDQHGASKHTTWGNTMKAALSVGDVLAQGIADLAEYFPEIIVVGVPGNHPRWCLSTDTEVWTKRGWKLRDELLPGDELFGINPFHKRGEWQPLEAVNSFDPPAEMIHLRGRSVDQLITPDHKVLIEDGEGYRLLPVKDAPIQAKFVVSAPNHQKGVRLTDDEIRFAAWFLTDGHIANRKRGYLAFTQRLSNASHITNLLDRMGLEYGTTVRKRDARDIVIQGKQVIASEPSVDIYLRAQDSRDMHHVVRERGEMPGWVWEMSARQFELFLDAFVDGDGSWARPGRSGKIYGKGRLMQEMQALLAMNGFSGNFDEGRSSLSFAKRDAVRVMPPFREVVTDYQDQVWCPTVRYGNFLMRRNGRASFTGNSKKIDWRGAHESFDYLTLTQTATRLQNYIDEGRVTIHAPDAYQAVVNIRGYNFLLSHGHEVKSWNGIPFYGLERKNRRIQTLFSQKDVQLHYHCIGHFHQAASMATPAGELFINGAWPRTSEYAFDALSVANNPMQMLFGVHEERGVTWRLPVYVAEGADDITEPCRYDQRILYELAGVDRKARSGGVPVIRAA